MTSIGLDFGTTNSAIAEASGDEVRLARFAHGAAMVDTFRSVLYFPAPSKMADLVSIAGPEAIEAYLASSSTGRLLQSMKSYLADPRFETTSVFGRALTLPHLLGRLLSDLRRQAEHDLGPLGRSLVVGRPVRFAHADAVEDEARALGRLEGALATAGFDRVSFAFEPVAAAYYYERRLDHDELILVGDFGGGTSDFTLARVGPGRRRGAPAILATDGVAIAGDALDGRIVERVVAPALGQHTTYRSMFGKALDMPVWPYERLRRWHHLSLLKSREVTEMLREIERTSTAPDQIELLREVIEDDLGFSLYRAVERVKVELSRSASARFCFEAASGRVERVIERPEFERWIERETSEMAASVDRVLTRAGLGPGDVDRVFLTGGTSLVPAVRGLFERRFGPNKISSGGELVSVASGLALMAREEHAEAALKRSSGGLPTRPPTPRHVGPSAPPRRGPAAPPRHDVGARGSAPSAPIVGCTPTGPIAVGTVATPPSPRCRPRRVWSRRVWFRGVWFRGVWFRGVWFRGVWFRGVWFRGGRWARFRAPLHRDGAGRRGHDVAGRWGRRDVALGPT